MLPSQFSKYCVVEKAPRARGSLMIYEQRRYTQTTGPKKLAVHPSLYMMQFEIFPIFFQETHLGISFLFNLAYLQRILFSLRS